MIPNRVRNLVVATVLAAVFIGCVDGVGDSPQDDRTPEPSLEYKLAAVSQGGYVRDGDPLVARFGRALDNLEAKCPESRQQLADMGVKGHQLLTEKQIGETLIGVLENWRASIPDDAQKGQLGRCADILAAYVTLRIGR